MSKVNNCNYRVVDQGSSNVIAVLRQGKGLVMRALVRKSVKEHKFLLVTYESPLQVEQHCCFEHADP